MHISLIKCLIIFQSGNEKTVITKIDVLWRILSKTVYALILEKVVSGPKTISQWLVLKSTNLLRFIIKGY